MSKAARVFIFLTKKERWFYFLDSIDYKTSLWVINREMWIQGPNLPKIILNNHYYCATAVNSTTVFFFTMNNNVGTSKVVTYDFMSGKWKILPNYLFIHGGLCTCTNFQNEIYKR